jgi:abhydrolase domain-containing protein 17
VELLLVLGVIYLLFALAAPRLADRMMFLPPHASYDALTIPFERVRADDAGWIAFLHVPHPTARYTILYNHGNAEDLGNVAPLLRHLHGLGFGVLGYDYRGYGRSSEGPPTAAKAIADAEAVWRHATGPLAIPADRIVLYGSSVGSGPAIELAARHEPAALIVEGAFTAASQVVTRIPLLPVDPFPNLQRMRRVRCPVLVIHGVRDEVIPIAHGRRLHAAAGERGQALWVEGAGHNDLLQVAGTDYDRVIVRFAEGLEAGPEG